MLPTLSLSLSFFFSSRRRHTSCALVTGVQTCALPIFAHLLGSLPRREAGGRVAAEDHEQLDARIAGSQPCERVSRVRHASGVDLDAGGLYAVHVGDGGLHQAEPLLRGRYLPGAVLLPGNVVDHPQDPVDPEVVAPVDGGAQVSDVGRVEGAPAYPQARPPALAPRP